MFGLAHGINLHKITRGFVRRVIYRCVYVFTDGCVHARSGIILLLAEMLLYALFNTKTTAVTHIMYAEYDSKEHDPASTIATISRTST